MAPVDDMMADPNHSLWLTLSEEEAAATKVNYQPICPYCEQRHGILEGCYGRRRPRI